MTGRWPEIFGITSNGGNQFMGWEATNMFSRRFSQFCIGWKNIVFGGKGKTKISHNQFDIH
jgi:hypothetical protein